MKLYSTLSYRNWLLSRSITTKTYSESRSTKPLEYLMELLAIYLKTWWGQTTDQTGDLNCIGSIPTADHVLNKHFGVSAVSGDWAAASHKANRKTQRILRCSRKRSAVLDSEYEPDRIANTRPSDVICILLSSISLFLLSFILSRAKVFSLNSLQSYYFECPCQEQRLYSNH